MGGSPAHRLVVGATRSVARSALPSSQASYRADVITRLTDIPRVTDTNPGDPTWYPLQHYFELTAFGANVFVASEPGQELVSEHAETASGQEEIYILTAGQADVFLDGKRHQAVAPSVVALTDPNTRRRIVATEPGATIVAIGAPARESFPSTWYPTHFDTIPRARDEY